MTQMVIDPHVLDATVRDHLNVTAPRTMAVLEGLKMTIENFDEMNLPATVTVPDFPSDPQCNKTHEVAFDRVVYIERSDYRQVFDLLDFFLWLFWSEAVFFVVLLVCSVLQVECRLHS
ncbi:hypothetical protein ANCCAN_01546 [Ancylostoma caninum]|uniref:Glutamyl/glutaminyl-tRNA synthetase class Ib anti-codon binding domain-containing protein n=1 Tax=Ancylostoma caninum TaxID=29170 RepID=A0A368H695_ANCCA|nr:hypothetical protein ANCCAN_01546 [Ancylostoma caninum]